MRSAVQSRFEQLLSDVKPTEEGHTGCQITGLKPRRVMSPSTELGVARLVRFQYVDHLCQKALESHPCGMPGGFKADLQSLCRSVVCSPAAWRSVVGGAAPQLSTYISSILKIQRPWSQKCETSTKWCKAAFREKLVFHCHLPVYYLILFPKGNDFILNTRHLIMVPQGCLLQTPGTLELNGRLRQTTKKLYKHQLIPILVRPTKDVRVGNGGIERCGMSSIHSGQRSIVLRMLTQTCLNRKFSFVRPSQQKNLLWVSVWHQID